MNKHWEPAIRTIFDLMLNAEETDFVTISQELEREHQLYRSVSSAGVSDIDPDDIFDYLSDEGFTTEAVTEGRYIRMYLTFKGLWAAHTLGLS